MLRLNKPVNIDRDRFFTEKEVTNKESREAKMNYIKIGGISIGSQF